MAKIVKYRNSKDGHKHGLRIRLIKAPLVDTNILREIIRERARAIII